MQTPPPEMPAWLANAIDKSDEIPPDQRLAYLTQHVHNEMVHGSGTVHPHTITQTLVDFVDEIAVALGIKAAPADPVKSKPSPTVTGGASSVGKPPGAV